MGMVAGCGRRALRHPNPNPNSNSNPNPNPNPKPNPNPNPNPNPYPDPDPDPHPDPDPVHTLQISLFYLQMSDIEVRKTYPSGAEDAAKIRFGSGSVLE